MSECDQEGRGQDGLGAVRGAGGDWPEPAPEIRRPRGSAWRRLEAEGVVWEGQVVLVGGEVGLAARLIVTRRRVAFVREGSVVLDVGREWLKPPPLMLPDGTIALSVSLDGEKAEDLFVQAREGRRVAGHLVTLLGGSGVRPARPIATPPSLRPATPPARPATGPAATTPPPAPALPGPVFPDEIGGLSGRPRSAPFGGLDVRPDPSPPRPYEPSWAKPRRSAFADVDRAERAVRAERSDRSERPERVAALAPMASPLDPPPRSSTLSRAPSEARRPETFALVVAAPADESSQVVPAPPAPAGVGRHFDWNLRPIRGLAPRAARRRRRQEWLARLLGLLILLIFTSVAISSRTPVRLPGGGEGERLAAPTAGPSQADVARALPTASPTATAVEAPAPGTTVVDLAAARTAEAFGVGGPIASETPPTATATVAPTPAPTSDARVPPAASGAGDASPDASGDPAAASFPGDVRPATSTPAADPSPTTEPTATAEPTATPAPTATATATATEAPTEPPLPTEDPTPSQAPTPVPTSTEPPRPTSTPTSTAVPTEAGAPADPSATEPAIPTQVPTLAQGEVPPQVFASGQFRYAIVAAVRAPSVPALGLYDYGTGDWVALFVDVVNWSEAPATLRMPDFTLGDASRAAPVLLDTGTALIARTFGLSAAYVHDAQVPYAPGEQHRILLLFLVHPEATDLTLRTGQAAVELEGILAETFDPADLPAEESIVPELIPATVVYVFDSETIEVEVSGVRQQVRYLGIEVPEGGDCWSLEAVQANVNLVLGQTVWLERQRSNADRQGRLLRDVWISAADGGKLLVAERLVALGAAEPKATTPNTRLSGWLAGVAQDAAAIGAGRWGFCPTASGGLALGPAFAAVLPLLLGLVWIALGTPGLEALAPRRPAARREEGTPDDRDD